MWLSPQLPRQTRKADNYCGFLACRLKNRKLIEKRVLRVNSRGDNVTVQTFVDGIERDVGTAFSTDTYAFYPVPVPMDLSYTLQFEITITSKEDIKLGEPMMLAKLDG